MPRAFLVASQSMASSMDSRRSPSANCRQLGHLQLFRHTHESLWVSSRTLTLPLELMFLITRAHVRQVEYCHAPTSFGNYLDNYQNHVYSRYLWNPRPKSFAPSVEHWSFPIFMFGPHNLGWRTKLNFVPSGRFFEVCGRWSRVSSLWRLQNRVPIKIIRPPSLRRTSKTLRLQHRLPSPVIKQ